MIMRVLIVIRFEDRRVVNLHLDHDCSTRTMHSQIAHSIAEAGLRLVRGVCEKRIDSVYGVNATARTGSSSVCVNLFFTRTSSSLTSPRAGTSASCPEASEFINRTIPSPV